MKLISRAATCHLQINVEELVVQKTTVSQLNRTTRQALDTWFRTLTIEAKETSTTENQGAAVGKKRGLGYPIFAANAGYQTVEKAGHESFGAHQPQHNADGTHVDVSVMI
jgi:hypothetical protein